MSEEGKQLSVLYDGRGTIGQWLHAELSKQFHTSYDITG